MPFPLEDFIRELNVATAALATSRIILIAPYDCKLVSVQSRQRVTSTSGTMDIVKAASGVALSAGVSLLTAVMSLSGTADTNISASLKTGIGDTTIPKGSSLGLIFAGTLTNLADFDATLILRQLKKA